MAVCSEDAKSLEEMAQSDIDVNVSWPDGLTGLHVSAQKGLLGIGQILVDNQASLDVTDVEGCTPLFLAAQTNQTEFVEFLLSKHANPNITNKDGWTALHIAAHYRYTHIVQVLAKWGCDISARTAAGENSSRHGRNPESYRYITHTENPCDRDTHKGW